ncbi:tetratricopeptide repeat protein [Paraburkholderia sp. GAS448]|uniref:tetratricopeptide repeat protein n=1 Tax=Paraburkholderia sp. GAS448 TaxID=3035136 RepID=UPI003D1D0A49
MNAAIQAGQYAQAEQMIKEVAPNHSASPRVHYMMAQVLSRVPGREGEARQEFKAAMSLNPQLPFADSTEVNALQERIRPHDEPPRPQEEAPHLQEQPIQPPQRAQLPLPASLTAPPAPPFVPHPQRPQMSLYDRVMLTIQENNIVAAAAVGVIAILAIAWSFIGRKKKGDGQPKKKDKRSSRRREPTGLSDDQGQEAEEFAYSNASPDHRDRTEHRENSPSS